MPTLIRKSLLLCGLLAAGAQAYAHSQSVPVHRIASRPAIMCGLSGRDARDLMERVRASATLRRSPVESDRFELFESPDATDQWAITRPSEPAYPAVTCRHLYNENGATYQSRDMRCDADRAACDHLLIEFQQLDQRMRHYVGGKR